MIPLYRTCFQCQEFSTLTPVSSTREALILTHFQEEGIFCGYLTFITFVRFAPSSSMKYIPGAGFKVWISRPVMSKILQA
jgi:hypothetical protein